MKKIKNLIPFALLGIAGTTFYLNYVKKDNNKLLSGFTGGFSGNLFGGVGSGELYEVETENQEEQTNNLNEVVETNFNNDFKTSLYYDNYKSSGGSSRNRTYIENDDLNFTVVKDNDKTVGGFDFDNKQSITKNQATFLEKNKNNPVIKIFRDTNSLSTTKKTASREKLEDEKKGGLF